jgi:oxygen-independent coproporphyrinogen III oxidase
MNTFKLINELEYDVTRPVCDMAAFFGYTPSSAATATLSIKRRCTEGQDVIEARLCARDGNASGSAVCRDAALSGEVARCSKLAVLQAFAALTGMRPDLPWGVLTGVRPGKLAHKLLDAGVLPGELVQQLRQFYLLPHGQGELLTSIVLRQKQLLADATRLTDAGIYIGVPYCPSRCSYCSFPAGIVPQDEESQQNFVNLIEQDLQNVVQLLGMHSLHVKSLYIGGGTPTSLSDKVFTNLLQAVERSLLRSAAPGMETLQEFTVEAGRPDCFSRSKLAAMEAVGVNRISVNPQTFHDKTLRLIGRQHTVADFYKAYERVRQSSIPVVNMDLIIGLPQETEADIAYSLEQARALAPENLTVHTLTLKRAAPLFAASQQAATLTAAAAARMVQQAGVVAQAMGLEPYYLYRQHYMLGHLANIGYAKRGTESIYNIQMMEERHPVIGVGPASASKVPLEDGHHLHKLNMPKNVAAYAANLAELAKKRESLFSWH